MSASFTCILLGLASISRAFNLHGLRYPSPIVNTVIFPVFTLGEEMDMKHFHGSYGNKNKNSQGDIAEQFGITLTEELQLFTGCSMMKVLREAIPWTTTSRATRKLQRAFVDLSAKKSVASIEGSNCTMIIRDRSTRYI